MKPVSVSSLPGVKGKLQMYNQYNKDSVHLAKE